MTWKCAVKDVSFGDVIGIAKRERVNTRMAAYTLALTRVAEAGRIRGLFP
jgi:glutamate dehydrogenase/leucine dehydrogenase